MAVYFIRAGSDGPVKIGTAANPTNRMRELQTGSSLPLHLLRVVDGNRETESAYHARFEQHAIHGEWFSYTPEMDSLVIPYRPSESKPEYKKPAEKIIAAFGGLTKTAQALGLPVTTVQGWKERGYIPAVRQGRVLGKARDLGININEADFFGDAA